MFDKAFRHRTTALALAAAGSMILAACGSNNSSGSSGGVSALLKPVPKAKITLTVWSFMPGEYTKGPQAYSAVVKAFEAKYPQVKINLENMPYGPYFGRVRDATVARKGPDVITMYGGAQAYSYRHGLYPLQNAMQPAVKKNLKFVADNYSKDGNLYILPAGTYGYALVVNRRLFAQAGISPAHALSSWSNFLGSCRELSAKGIQPIASGWKDGYLFETFMYMMSSEMMDTATLKKWVAGKIPVDAPMFKTATGYILDMNKAGCFGGKAALGRNMYDDAFNQYYAGKTAMMVTGSMSTAEQSYHSVPSTTVMRFPQVPGSKYTNLIDAGAETGWGVTKWTKYPEAAGAFVNFLVSPQAETIIWKTVEVPPNLKNVTVKTTTPMQKAFVPLMENPVNHTGFEAFPLTVLATYERNAAPLISGSMSPAEFTSQAQSAFQQSH
ncbi:MAG TPA: extracellular solute-binding protein [Chloroflexota bacterium]|nr:extracellular solute-binding protein [Chloroflexota bacterium]